MPQNRRKTPFSGKQKKQQLIVKKQNKNENTRMIIRKIKDESEDQSTEASETTAPVIENIQKINLQPFRDPRSKSNRYVLQFHSESPKELKLMKEEARKSLNYRPEEELEIADDYFSDYDMPIRPNWDYLMSKDQLEANENRYFFKYITALEKKHYDDMKPLSYCELNLETWRQLWRVLELSDIVLIICDARFPTLMFPPALHEYVTGELKKDMIIVLNKIDLVPAPIVLAWKKYFEEKYKSLKVVLFTSCPSYNLRGSQQNKTGLQIRRRRGRMRMAAEGAMEVLKATKEIVKNEVDLSSWEKKVADEMNAAAQDDDDDNEEKLVAEKTHDEEKDFDFEKHEKYKNGVVTIGCVGFPNVGKSSLLNALYGRKVASVSRTPGHTKHFQTIFLTEHVRLCDCPGLVFPSQTPRKLQVLMGSYPIAQLREPYGAIRFLAERIDLQKLLVLTHPEKEEEWSAIDVCDAFALKRGFFTAKAARPDSYRAANSILRMALDGKITLALRPKGFKEKEAFWNAHPELEFVKTVQSLGKSSDKVEDIDLCSDSDENETAGPSDYKMKEIKRTKNDVKNAKSSESDESDDEDAGPVTKNPFDLLGEDE